MYCDSMTQKGWAVEVSKTIGRNIKGARRAAGKMSAQDLADRCAELGHPIQRDVISNLENGRRASVPITDLIVLAEALRLPALSLIFDPATAGAEIERLPGRKCYAWEAAEDFAGIRPEGFGRDRRLDASEFSAWKKAELLHDLGKYEEIAFERAADANAIQETWEDQKLLGTRRAIQGRDPLDQTDQEYKEQLDWLESQASRALSVVHRLRQELQSMDVNVWPVPEILRHRYDAMQPEDLRGKQ